MNWLCAIYVKYGIYLLGIVSLAIKMIHIQPNYWASNNESIEIFLDGSVVLSTQSDLIYA
jgi:hypothetical protein